MKKILIFSLAYYPRFIGGAEIALKEITDRIDPRDIEFHMVTLRYDSSLPQTSREGNVVVHRIGFTRPHPSMEDLQKFPLKYNKYLFQWTAVLYALRLHRRERFDAIWAMMVHGCGIPAVVFKFLVPRVKYVLTLQEGDPPKYVERLMRSVWPLFVQAFKKADVVQTISTFLGKWARGMGFTGPLEVIPNGVDVSHFSRSYGAEEIAAMQESLGKNKDDIFLVTTSRLVYKNAIDDVIRALTLLPQSVHFIILGIGPEEENLKALATDLEVYERVQFIGQISHAEMPKYLKASDIFVRASRSEGMGNSFVEAMAAGLPVIATQEGGIADFLFDSERNPDQATTGWAVDKDSPEQIAKMVKEILADPEKVKMVTTTAKAMVVEKYDWDVIVSHMQERVFKPLLGL